MKINKEQLEEMKRAIVELGINEEKAQAYWEQLEKDSRVKDVQVRFLFDVFYAAGIGRLEWARTGEIHNDHFHTALKKIGKGLWPKVIV